MRILFEILTQDAQQNNFENFEFRVLQKCTFPLSYNQSDFCLFPSRVFLGSFPLYCQPQTLPYPEGKGGIACKP